MRSGVEDEDGDINSMRDIGIGIRDPKLPLRDVVDCDVRRGDMDIVGDDSNSVTAEPAGDAVEFLRNLLFISSMASVFGTGLPDARRGLPNVEEDPASDCPSKSGLLKRSSRRNVVGLSSGRPDRVCTGPDEILVPRGR